MGVFAIELDDGSAFEIEAETEEEAVAAAQQAASQQLTVGSSASIDLTSQDEPKAGIMRSIADSLVELGTGTLGLPADISQSLGSDPVTPTSDELNQMLAEFGIHSGAQGSEDRTRGGQIAKVGSDLVATAAPIAAAPALAARGKSLAENVTDIADVNLPSSGQLQTPDTALGQIVDQTVNTVAKDTNAVLGTEAAVTASAAGGAAAAEAVLPGNEDAQLAGALAGAFLSPTSLAVAVGGAGRRGLSKVTSIFSESGRQDRAAKLVQDVVEEVGEDPETLARILRQSEPGDALIPSTEKTGSEALAKLDAFVARSDPGLDNEKRKLIQQGYDEMRRTIDQLRAVGDPQAIRVAAIMERNYVESVVDDAIAVAQRGLDDAAQKLTPETSTESTGVAISQQLVNARNMLKQTERELWGGVQRDAQVSTSSLADTYGRIRSETTPELLEEQPIFLEKAVQRLSEAGTATSSQLIQLRSDLFDKASDLRAAGNNNQARILEELGDAALDGLNGLPGYDQARAFSKAFHDRFTRTFANNATKTKSTGELSVSPDELSKKAFAGGGPTGNVRLQQLEDAGNAASPEIGAAIKAEEERFLQTVVEKFVKEDGTVGRGLNNFVRTNRQLLERFPQLAADLQDAQKATQILTDAKTNKISRMKEIERSAISQVAGDENPVRAVGSVLSGKTPDAGYKELADTARQSGDEALRGLATATVDNAADTAGGSFAKLADTIPFDLMAKNDVLPKDQLDRLRSVVKRAAEIEKNTARASSVRAEDIADPVDSQMIETLIRIAGAKAGSAINTITPGSTSGASLIAAQAGSKTLRNKLLNLPFKGVVQIIKEASNDPKLMAALMTRNRRPEQAEEATRRIHAAAVSAGILSQTDDEE